MRLRTLIPYALPIFLLSIAVSTQYSYDRVRFDHLKNVSISINELIEPTVPNEKIAQQSSLGFNNVLADGLWLTTIQYYGGGDPYGRFRQLPKLIRTINQLDPKFIYPYTFAGLVVSSEGYPDEALSILEYGEKQLPDNWELPYYQGTIYYINKKDYAKSAESYKRASLKPGAPKVAEFLSAVQSDKSNDRATAKKIFESIASDDTNVYFKDRAKSFVLHYQLLDELDKVIAVFKEKEKRYPTSLNELVSKRYVQEIPEDPLKRKLEYDKGSGKVTDVSK